MEETVRSDGFEATFTVSTPRADAWQRLVGAAPVFDGMAGPTGDQWWIPAIEGAANPTEVREGELFRGVKATFPCAGTEIVLRLEDADSGTRITIVQTGFGDGFAEGRPWLATGWYAILADLVAYFEHGVALGRHALMWAGIGCEVEETDAGLRVASVNETGLARDAGLAAGDLIVQVAGAPVVSIRDLSVLMRGPLQALGTTKVRWLRDGRVMSASAAV